MTADGNDSRVEPSPPQDLSHSDATVMQRIVLAPMVRGSELAFRMFLRSIYPSTSPLLCYSPMLRAPHVIQAHQQQQLQVDGGTAPETSLHEDARLFLHDLGRDTEQLVVQLCGSSPTELYAATNALLDRYPTIHGVDLNLGCPQSCARDGRFGAFLTPTTRIVECLQAMRRAIGDHATAGGSGTQCVLSCKIRLQDTEQETLALALAVQAAGVDRIAVHCRTRDVKFDGVADLEMGRKIVAALDIPVWINGAHITCTDDVHRVLRATGAPRLMIARDWLANPRLLCQRPTNDSNDSFVAALAANYLAFATRYPPPTPEYFQVHLKWIFRRCLAPPRSSDIAIDYSNWRHRLWNFLRRPYLVSLLQFQCTVALFVHHAECQRPTSLPDTTPLAPTYNMIRHWNKQKGAPLETRPGDDATTQASKKRKCATEVNHRSELVDIA